jgi:hypothetical protein
MLRLKTLVFVALVIFTSAATVNAQTYKDFEDVVYLKNGSIIHGVIIEQIPNEKVKIQSGKNVFVYTFDEIEKIVKEEIVDENPSGLKDFGHKPKGFVFHYEIGLTDYIASSNIPMFSILLTHGYQVNPHLFLGLSAGADISAVNAYNVPVYFDLRGYFLKSRFTPYAELGLGYNLIVASRSSGLGTGSSTLHGFLIHPNFGGRFAINKKLGATIGLGYRFVGAASKSGSWRRYRQTFGSYNAVTLRFGILF